EAGAGTRDEILGGARQPHRCISIAGPERRAGEIQEREEPSGNVTRALEQPECQPDVRRRTMRIAHPEMDERERMVGPGLAELVADPAEDLECLEERGF